MKIIRGTIKEHARHVDELVREYYAKTIASEGMRPLKFKWHTYQLLEDAGAVQLFIAKVHDRVIGFALYVVQEHLHHDGQNVAQCTMMGVRPEYRGRGIGRQLVEYAEGQLREAGATHMVHHHRTLYKVIPLFEHLGFKLAELEYVKEL